MGSVSMDANKLGTGLKDAISLLPQEVLGDILSLLPTKLAASTSVLSKKWRNVFALVDNLDLDDSVFLQPEEGKLERDVIRESFRNFVDTTLALQCGYPIKKLSLKYHFEDSEMAYMARWISSVVERGVLEVDLCLNPDFDELYLPSELFTSKTLVKLTLGTDIYLGKIPPDGLDGYTGDAATAISLFKVKVLRVLGYRGTAKELERLKCFLVGTECLELVRVEIPECVVVDDGILSQVHRDLKALVRVSVSSNCLAEVDYFI